MRRVLGITLTVCALAGVAPGQRVSFGVVVGTHLTNNFPIGDTRASTNIFPNFANSFQLEKGPRSFIVGASLEGRLSDAFSIEANVLHRPLKARTIYTGLGPDGSSGPRSETRTLVRTWEFPVLLKYSFRPTSFAPSIRPFLALGPSFRTREEAVAARPSRIGMTAAAGLTIPWGRFRVSPTLRYTRWRQESIARYATKPDQLELLASFAYETRPATRRVAGRKLEIGALLGIPVTDGFAKRGDGGASEDSFRYIAGFTAQMDVADHLGVEVDAIYTPLRGVSRIDNQDHAFSVLTWEFPVLAKYRFGSEGWRPVIEVGPSFRLAGNLNGYRPSRFGLTVGAGLEKRVGVARLSPRIRYTRWAEDSLEFPSASRTNANAVAVLFGLSF